MNFTLIFITWVIFFGSFDLNLTVMHSSDAQMRNARFSFFFFLTQSSVHVALNTQVSAGSGTPDRATDSFYYIPGFMPVHCYGFKNPYFQVFEKIKCNSNCHNK